MNDSSETLNPPSQHSRVHSKRIRRLAAFAVLIGVIGVSYVPAATESARFNEPALNTGHPVKVGRTPGPLLGNLSLPASFQTCPQRRSTENFGASTALYRVSGRVYDKADRVLPTVTVNVSSATSGFSCGLSTKGRFVIYLPAGLYAFRITSGPGGPNVYRNLRVSSDTSINFMFASRTDVSDQRISASLSASASTITRGETFTLSWVTENATSVRINPGIGNVDSRGSVNVSPSFTTTYTLIASNSASRAGRSVTVTVLPGSSLVPKASLRVSKTKIEKGESVTLSWTTGDATSVLIKPGIGVVDDQGSVTVSPSTTTRYALTASNDSGTATRTVTVSVLAVAPASSPTPTPTPASPTPTPEDSPTQTPTVTPVPPIAGPQATPVTDTVVPGISIPYLEYIIPGLIALVLAGLIWFFWPSLAAIAPWLAGTLGALGVAGKTTKADEVHCTLYSQSEVGAGTDLLVQVFAHLLEQQKELTELAQELDPDAKKQLSKALKKPVQRESVLTFKLMVPGIDLDEEEQDLIWKGEPDSVEFIIPIPEDHPAGKRFGRVYVYNNGEEIGKIPFRINILPRELQLDLTKVQPKAIGEMTDNETAFVSYASRDKDRVYRFVQLMDILKYEYHIDIFHIDAGDRWEQKLYEFIGKDDVFLLFWSEAASQSEWVIKEAKLAKERSATDKRGLPRIVIYNLDGRAPVPEWLQDIHVDRKWAEIIGSIDKQQGNTGATAG